MSEKIAKNTGKTIDMTQGKPFKVILFFAVPIFMELMFQNFYNIVDTAIAGNVLGDGALAAIGATSSIYNLLIALAMGLNNGFALLISRAFGAHDQKGVNTAIAWALLLNAICVAVLTSAALIFLNALLRAMNTPEEIYDSAKLYIKIILIGVPVTMAYNMEASVLRSMGNSTTPLICLIIASVLNVTMNLLFITVFNWGVAGIAIATVLAQLVAVIFCLIYLFTHYHEIKITRDCLNVPKGYVPNMLVTGISMGMVGIAVSFGGAVLQSAVNKLGSTYIAGHIGGGKIEIFFSGMINSTASSSATYASQNFGAKKPDRIRKGLVATLTICFCCSAISIAFALSPLTTICVKLITGSDNEEVIACGAKMVKYTMLASPFLSVLMVLRNTLQGMGHKLIPVFAGVFEMAGKLIYGWTLVPRYGYTAVCLCQPSIWAICAIFLVFTVLFFYRDEFKDGYAKPAKN